MRKHMNRARIILVFGFITMTGLLTAQEELTAGQMKKLGLNDSQIQKIEQIQKETEKTVQTAQLELNLYKAQLQKLLYASDPDMKEVERIMRQSMEMKLVMEMALIQARVRIRQSMGEDCWGTYLKEQNKIQTQNKEQSKAPSSAVPGNSGAGTGKSSDTGVQGPK